MLNCLWSNGERNLLSRELAFSEPERHHREQQKVKLALHENASFSHTGGRNEQAEFKRKRI